MKLERIKRGTARHDPEEIVGQNKGGGGQEDAGPRRGMSRRDSCTHAVITTEVNDHDEGQRYDGTSLRGLAEPIPDTQHVPLGKRINNDSRPMDVKGTTDKVPLNEKRSHLVVLGQDNGGRLMKTCRGIIASDWANEKKMTPVRCKSYKTYCLGKVIRISITLPTTVAQNFH